MINTPVGFDLGNGTTAISVCDKVSKIPNGYAMTSPRGAIGKNKTHVKAKAFSILVNDQSLWFDQDILSERMIREIDLGKYNADYIKTMFSAALVKAITQHKIDPPNIGLMNVVCSMPPELWQDAGKRKIAESAYRSVFNNGKAPWYVQGDSFHTFRISTRFGGIEPEAMSYSKAFGLKPDYTVITDIGSGTVDYVVFKNDPDKPLLVKSVNDGLLHAYEELGGVNSRQTELAIVRGDTSRNVLSPYFNEIKLQLNKICRKLDTGGETVNLVLIGGGCKLMTPETKTAFRQDFHNIVIKDEFVNVRANARLAV